MKIKNILISGLSLVALTACTDYLNVDAPSKYTTDYVYSNVTEINTALNGLYTEVLNDNAFGKAYYETLALNSDVDFKTFTSANSGNNNIRRFDCDATSGTVNSIWNQAYAAIDAANVFIYNVENSELLTTKDSTEVYQKLGEAKCIRAMFYNELTEYWGDVPAPFKPTIETDDMTPQIQSRDDIRYTLIQDLAEIAPKMQSATDLKTIERFSQEACYALISRIALNAGGYSLRPDDSNTYGKMARPSATSATDLRTGATLSTDGLSKTFYTIAMNAAAKVIDSGVFSFSKTFPEVFIDECNFEGTSDFDDPIMEIPFAKEANGNVGYLTGPKMASNNSETEHNWGEAGGSLGINHFYPYTFDSDDQRGSYLKGAWQYTYQTIPSLSFSYTWYNNKWSKLWNTTGLGSTTSTKTGINYPYIRYADVLLMYAEASNELNGPTTEAVRCVDQVRQRAYQSNKHALTADEYADKSTFLTTILNERAKEFAGENMRWKDLVRNNIYNAEIFWTFTRYFGVASDIGGNTSNIPDYLDVHDGKNAGFYSNAMGLGMPQRLYWCYIDNPGDQVSYVANSDTVNHPDCYVKVGSSTMYYPQTSKAIPVVYYISAQSKPTTMPQTYINNLGLGYTVKSQNEINSELTSTSKEWNEAILSWDNDGVLKNEIRYSLFGFIQYDEADNTTINTNGTYNRIDVESMAEQYQDPKSMNELAAKLPVLRYILPIPREAISRSNGSYKNYYGY